jgi:hypothetical protein
VGVVNSNETKEGQRLWELVRQLPFTVAEATRVQKQSAANKLDEVAKRLSVVLKKLPEVYLEHCAAVRRGLR